MKHRVEMTDTTLRDAHQSLWATRMRTEDMLPIAERLDQVGYHSLEVWGGATFDVCMRFLNEDPWERLRQLKKVIKKTPLQMLLRGQSLVGYTHYPDDMVERFCYKMVENGIDIIRIFDALNDVRNLEVPIKMSKKAGAHVQPSVVYTISPVHNDEHFLETALQLVDMGADSICIKDMAGLLSPYKAYDLVKLFKSKIKVPIQLHSHYVGGMAVGSYLKATEAGVDVIDTASVPLAFGTSQPPVETVVRALKESPYDTRLNIHDLFEVANYFEELREKLGYERGVTKISYMRVFEHQVPGGMITNFISQLEQQKAMHRYNEVLEEIPRVREDLGYPPLVTPTSQLVGNQAVLNVLCGERYKMVPGEVRSYLKGYYGKPPAPMNQEVVDKVLGDRKDEIIHCRPADLLEPIMGKLEKEISDLATCEEDVLSYGMFPQVAKKFFENRLNKDKGNYIPEQAPMKEQKAVKVAVGAPEEAEEMNLEQIKELIQMLSETDISELKLESGEMKVVIRKGNESGVTDDEPAVKPRKEKVTKVAEPKETKAEEEIDENLVAITAPMVGTFYQAPSPEAAAFAEVGQEVKTGQTVCIIEAMKLMNEIEAEVNGKVVKQLVENGQPVEYGQILFLIEPK